MLEKHVQSFNKITQDIENWISNKHKISEVKQIKKHDFFLCKT